MNGSRKFPPRIITPNPNPNPKRWGGGGAIFLGGNDPDTLMNILTFTIDLDPASIYLFKVNNKNTRKRSEIYSRSTVKAPERLQ